jgi:hypothetical protein
MKAKTLIPFIVVLAVLGGLIALRTSQKETVSMRDQAGLESVTPEGLDAATVQRIELYASATPDQKVDLKREGEGWVIASLYNAPAKTDVVDAFLKKLAGIQGEPRDTADTDERLAAYQLKDDEAFRVRAYTSDSETPEVELLFGKAPDFRTVFFRKAGDAKVYLETANLRQEAGVSGDDMSAAPKPDRWINKEIVALDDKKITKLAYTMPDKNWVLERRELPAEDPAPAEGEAEGAPAEPAEPKYEWAMAAGGIPDATVLQTGIDRIMGRLRAYQANTFADPAKKAELGLDNPPFKLTISMQEGEDITFVGSRPDTSATGVGYLMREGAQPELIYELSRFNFEYVFLKAADLYTLPGVTLDKTAIDRVELNHAQGGRSVLAKADGKWTVVEPALGVKAEQTKIDALLNSVASLAMQDYAETAVASFEHSVTVHAGGTTRTLQAGGKSPVMDGYYVTMDGDPRTYAINTSDYEAVFFDPSTLFAVDAVTFGPDEFLGVHFGKDGKIVAVDREGEGWNVTVDGGTPFPGDTARIESMIDVLDRLPMDGLYTGAMTADWTPFLTISVRAQDGRSHLLNIGPADGDIHPVKLDGRDILFKMTKDSANLLQFHFDNVQQQPKPPAPAETAATPAETPAPEAAPADAMTPETAPAADAPVEIAPVEVVTETPAEAPAAEAAPAEAPVEVIIGE